MLAALVTVTLSRVEIVPALSSFGTIVA